MLEDAQAHDEAAMAWRLIVLVHGIAGRYSEASVAVERSIAHARTAGNDRLVARNGLILAMNALYGATPAPQAIAQCEQLLAHGLGDRQIECNVRGALAQLKAMNGELEAARSLYRRSRADLRDLGQGIYAAATGIDVARVELRGGNLAAACDELRVDYDFLAAKSETYFLSTIAALLSRMLRDLGRDEEALFYSNAAEQATADDDLESQALWRMIRAPILARTGKGAEAEALARAAVELTRRTEAPILQADALAELAAVLHTVGNAGEARESITQAMALYTTKGDVVSAARAAAWAHAVDQRTM